jgi:polysaccharide deacetylase family protein (PEP-CTERM system associated)
MLNAFSIDVEDWFCVSNMKSMFKFEDWDGLEYRAELNTKRLLDKLDKFGIKATFFILGWIAEKSPSLIREIELRGHEIGFHTYSHKMLTELTEEEFISDLKKGLDALKNSGIESDIIGFRAPSFSITKETLWALDILRDFGFKYDSSVFPVSFHPDYGIPDSPLESYEIIPGLIEFPVSVSKSFGRNIPCSGGGYFRLLPYGATKYLLKNINEAGRPFVFYLHPWEIDKEQPKIKLPLSKSFRHYNNIGKTERRLDSLFGDFQFTTLKYILGL